MHTQRIYQIQETNGDIIKATWTDGLITVGAYLMHDKGYVILIDKNNNIIVCNPHSVKFEIISEAGWLNKMDVCTTFKVA